MQVAKPLAVVLAAAVLAGGAGRAQEKDKKDEGEAKRVADATTVFSEIMSAEDKAIPRAILGKAEAIVVIPNTIKAGLGIGGMRGRGIISARNKGAWSAPAFLTLTGGSFGLQIGAAATDVVLVVQNRRGLENLVQNQFKVGANAGVAAGPVGREAQAATDIQLRAEILSYSRSRGAFAGITIEGSTIQQDLDANQRFYGRPLTTKQILFEGAPTVPPSAKNWDALLVKYAG